MLETIKKNKKEIKELLKGVAVITSLFIAMEFVKFIIINIAV
jgi:hypothetical protein